LRWGPDRRHRGAVVLAQGRRQFRVRSELFAVRLHRVRDGGTGSIWGPLAGGLFLAALQIAASYLFGSPSLNYATLLAAVLFFAFRPEGIFARRVRH
jgi:hypothetical protein